MATASDERAAADVLKSLARHLNCLNDDNKSARRRALETVKKETVEQRLSSGALQELFAGLLKALLKCLSDPAETCRDTAIQILTSFIRAVPRPEDSLPYLMPSLVQRLGGQEILEPAEELRLALMEMLSLLLEVCGRQLAPYLDDMIKILQRTITDPFPEVKKESCKCAISAAQSIPNHFHLQAESLLKPLLQTISHQHSQVRVCVTQAIGAVIQHSTGKNLDDVLSHMAQRLFDDSPRVRKAVTIVVGDWLLRLPDRYSYFHKLIPLLLSSLSDEIPEIRSLAEDLWRQVGSQWEKENEDDLKDKMDFLLPAPVLYTSGVECPGLGCRELVVRNLSKLLPAVGRDMGDWLVQTRVKTAQLLRVLLLHAEDHCTQHLQSLLTLLYRACADPETDVRAQCLESAKLLGVFVSPEVYLKLLLPHVEDSSSCSPASPWAPLMVLGSVLRGSSREALEPHLITIGGTLSHPEVCQGSQQAQYLDQLLVCVDAVLCVCQVDCAVISLQLLKVLVSVQSLTSQQEQCSKAEESVRCLCEAQGLGGVCELYRQHMADLLQWLSDSHHTWTSYSIQKTQLEIIAMQSGPVVGEFLPALLPLLKSCLELSRDPELRLHIFTMLSKLLLDSRNTLDSQGRFAEYMDLVLQDLLLPNLVWRSGRSATAVRTAALSCLLAVLHGAAFPVERVLSVEETLSTQLISALEEDSKLARLLACRSLHALLKLTTQRLNTDSLNKIYPELLKRVDDSSEDVRVEALMSLSTWFSSLGRNYDTQSCRPHLEFLFQQLLLYMDDPDTKIQDSVLEVLKVGSEVDGGLLQQQTEAVREKQRSPEYCDQLLRHIHSFSEIHKQTRL
ncbi:dynein axonemal assembly factor 5-like [Carassius carassius]|uniref:dynein axonemal assembly factor 5-like n=1 Tax=Carassius carassius TaxID=217509 RepID=UPI002868C872|nr:dynein axonemal assembly factor 5-like [Carassius carassius]